MHFYNGPYGGIAVPEQISCNVVYGPTPLLRGIGCVLSQTTYDVHQEYESIVQGVPGRSVRWTLLLLFQVVLKSRQFLTPLSVLTS